MNDKSIDFEELLPGHVYHMLLEAAMIGIQVQELLLCNHITQSLIDVRPDLPDAHVVWALSEQFSGREAHAVRILEEAHQRFPESQRVRAILGGCMKVSDRPGWRAILDAVIDDGRDRHAVALACSLLQLPLPPSPDEQALDVGTPPSALPPQAMWV